MTRATRRGRLFEAVLVSIVILAASARRCSFLDRSPLWADEAESSINALTILQSGYPASRYQGLPIFENTLVKPWPDDPEYEFKDISYSDKGVATYHGWLPLYSIAASFKLNGIRPATSESSSPPHRDLTEYKRKTRAARLPAVWFGALFLLLCYIGGTVLYGRDAGVTALVLASIHAAHVYNSVTARYYSATVSLSTAVVILLWLMATKGEWKYYLLGAISFVLLFHTHLVTFAAGVCVLGLLSPVLFRQPSFLQKAGVFTLVIATGIVPWIIATSFLSNVGVIPAARSLLSFPSDLFVYPLARPVYCVLVAVFAIALGIAGNRRFRHWSLAQPLRQGILPFSVLSLWILFGYSSFLLLIPAASFFPDRLNLSYWGPAVLLGSVFCAVLCRMLLRRASIVLAPAIALLLLASTDHLMSAKPSQERGGWEGLLELASYMNSFPLSRDTKLYAAPNHHLVLSFYLGMPFQSIAPVRKSFLDRYEGDLVYIEPTKIVQDSVLSVESLRPAAEEEHQTLTTEDTQTLSLRLQTLDYRTSILKIVGRLNENSLEPLPRYASLAFEKALGNEVKRFAYQLGGAPIFRNFEIKDYHDWMGVFIYRFVDPMSRMGANTNYSTRLAGSRCDILTSAGWAIYHCSRRCDWKSEGVDFRILP